MLFDELIRVAAGALVRAIGQGLAREGLRIGERTAHREGAHAASAC
jgi:hypothetical protein